MRLAVLLLVALAGIARADPDPAAYLLSMCKDMTSWTPKQLAELSDAQIEKFVCISAKANLRAITTADRVSERQCMAAARNLVGEFTRRWPRRDIAETVGKC